QWRYTLGPSPLVRDTRSGKTTGRLDLVLDGHLDIFLMPADEQRPHFRPYRVAVEARGPGSRKDLDTHHLALSHPTAVVSLHPPRRQVVQATLVSQKRIGTSPDHQQRDR